MQSSSHQETTRRDFLKTGTTVGMAATLFSQFAATSAVYAGGDDVLRVGLVGCGGRGTGAALQALMADPNTKLVAMGDAFPEAIDVSLKILKKQEIADRVVVDEDHCFAGLQAYRDVIDSCDVVLLASPPGFRPEHIAYAVEQGKHIFAENPVATDAPGVRSVRESLRIAREKKLGLMAGFCWRYDSAKRAFFEKVNSGAIGEVLGVYAAYLASPVKPMPPASTRPAGMTDLEWQVRNWYNFCWLSGDGLVEQAIHVVDWIGWAKGDVPPVRCHALGGRQTPSNGGDNFDHVEVNYLWADDSRGFVAQRQMSGCYRDYSCSVLATKGKGSLGTGHAKLSGATEWKYDGPLPNMYLVEHEEFFASLRKGEPWNDGERLINTTLMAIMGRMAAYSGQEITWEMALNSQEQLVPPTPDWNAPVEFRPTPIPGTTPFV